MVNYDNSKNLVVQDNDVYKALATSDKGISKLMSLGLEKSELEDMINVKNKFDASTGKMLDLLKNGVSSTELASLYSASKDSGYSISSIVNFSKQFEVPIEDVVPVVESALEEYLPQLIGTIKAGKTFQRFEINYLNRAVELSKDQGIGMDLAMELAMTNQIPSSGFNTDGSLYEEKFEQYLE